MSFSGAVKNDLVRIQSSQDCCRLAEFAAFLRISGSLHIGSRQKLSFSLTTQHAGATRRMFTYIKELFNLNVQVLVQRKNRLHKNRIYNMHIPPQEGIGQLLALLGIENPHALGQADYSRDLAEKLLAKGCCRRAYLRGAFLAGGSINHPAGAYHLEISCHDRAHARLLQELLADFGISAKITQRKQHFVVYLKDSEAIATMLNILGSHRSLLEFENTRIVKEIRNQVNRQMNCENANLNKTVATALQQIEDIKLIDAHMGLDKLPDTLRQAAQVRLSNPNSSLSELAEEIGLGRSGINHRLRRIKELAEDIRQQQKP